MRISPLFRASTGAYAYAGVASGTSPRATSGNSFQPDIKAQTRAAYYPARVSSGNVVLAHRAVDVALRLMRAKYPLSTQMRAVRLLMLAYAVLRRGSQPASATSNKSANGSAAKASVRSENRSSQTRYSAASSRPRAERKMPYSDAGTRRAQSQYSAHGAKRTNTEVPKPVPAVSSALADSFKVLGLPVTASATEAKKAYYKAAREHHPDKGGNEEKFKALSNAYEALKLHFEKAKL
jgi:DnaJ-domain-containing protein 1